MTAPGSRHRVRRLATETGYAARCSCGWATVRRSRELRDQDVNAHEMTTAAERVAPVSRLVCRQHYAPVSPRGTGCEECDQPRPSARRQRLQRRQAIAEAYERLAGGELL